MPTSRERVLATLNHREPDRVAVDLSGYRSSGISAIVYPKLRAALGLEPRTVYVYDPVQQLAIVDQDVLDLFGVDTIELGREFCHEDRWWVDWTLPDGTPCKMPVWAAPEKRPDDQTTGGSYERKTDACWRACRKGLCISTRFTGPGSKAKRISAGWTTRLMAACGRSSAARRSLD